MGVVMIAQANDVTHSEIKLMFHPDEFCNLVFQNKWELILWIIYIETEKS